MTAVPDGKVIRRLRGGPEALKALLRDLRRYAFTGYVRTLRMADGEPAAGVLAIKAGDLLVALRSRGPATLRGSAALKEVWSDARESDCAIELHAKVDVDAIARDHPDAVLERPKRIAKRPKPIAVEADLGVLGGLEGEVRSWRAAGFDTTEVEAALPGDLEAARAAVAAFREGVKRSLGLQEALDGLHVTGSESRVAAIREKLRDVRLLTVAEAEIADLRAEQEARVAASMRPANVALAGEVADHAGRAFEVIVKSSAAPTAAAIVRSVPAEPEETTPPRDERTNLIRRYMFDSFVVGPSNRFAHAAALAVAKSAKSAYNPLFITSASGLGKTHLLNAIGNAVAAARPEARIVYLSAEVFTNEFHRAKGADALEAFRGKYRSVDLFLLDDVHFLAGQGDIQEELFHTFD